MRTWSLSVSLAVALSATCLLGMDRSASSASTALRSADSAFWGTSSVYGNEIIRGVQTDEKLMAFTFDDGPTPDETPPILDLLKQYDAKATFFLLGQRVERFPDVVRREVAEGHELANHTFSHILCTPGTSAEKLRSDISKAQETIAGVTGQKPRLFRPAEGFFNEQLLQFLHAQEMRMILWSKDQDPWDWNRPGVERIVRTILNNASGGDIVLLHDHVHGKSDTIRALAIVLPELKQRGYRLVTVSELLRHQKQGDAASAR
ncbi:polysaccharide deacetylase family protein [Paenibacillus cremeus]|uniref:Polysaccharide deacetylase family protein n=1 Tax=Paenibacillus cremeus TaxID=2163881 RepID=A0A559KF88_9BACL|nr:polysaccharide deacetylase family protein [Paenibacillus cremeus]TVY10794.1 polysaccharide deacetylase family protein [Paenibacillus cremeus]